MKKILAVILALTLIAVPMAVSAFQEQTNHDIRKSAGKAAVAPVIDGKLDIHSYEKIALPASDLNFNGDEEAFLLKAGPELDFYVSWDDNNLYVFLSGDASKFYYCDHDGDSPGDTGNIWNQSCIQISVARRSDEGGDRMEMGLARNSSNGNNLWQVWAQHPDAAAEFEPEFGKNVAILLEGGKLSYEVAIPFNTFAVTPAAGVEIGLNFMYGWSDDGSRLNVEYSLGCNAGKDASLFSTLTLGANVLEEPAPEPEPEPEAPAVGGGDEAPEPPPVQRPTAPTTGDAGMIALIALMALAAFGVVAFRKRAAK